MSASIRAGSLVLYKIHPARVSAVGEKIEIELAGGKSRKVRPKDVTLLHPGPLNSLAALEPPPANIEEAWELLQGEQPAFEEVAELVFGEFTPASAWATWELLQGGLYFSGGPGAVKVNSPEQVATLRAERERKQREAEAWEGFLARVAQAALEEADRKRLAEVERVALGDAGKSRILEHFKVEATPEAAHRFLLRCGYWAPEYNPWPRRAGAVLESPQIGVPALPEEDRLDLTHLEAWAIDDVGNQDPDDAISLDGDYLVGCMWPMWLPWCVPTDISTRRRASGGAISTCPSALSPCCRRCSPSSWAWVCSRSLRHCRSACAWSMASRKTFVSNAPG